MNLLQARDNYHHQNNEHISGEQPQNDPTWQSPHTCFVKCNIDTTLFAEEGKFGGCFCNHDEGESFLKAKTTIFNGISPPQEVDAFCLLQGIQLLKSEGCICAY